MKSKEPIFPRCQLARVPNESAISDRRKKKVCTIETTGRELVNEGLVELGGLLACGELPQNVLGLLLLIGSGLSGGSSLLNLGVDLRTGLRTGLGLGSLALLILAVGLGGGLASKGGAVVGLVPLTEGGGINLDDGALNEGLGPDELVGRGVVDDINQTGLAGDSLRGPGVVASLQTESAELLVATTGADKVDPLGTELGEGRGTTHVEVPLLHILGALSSGGAPLVARITADT